MEYNTEVDEVTPIATETDQEDATSDNEDNDPNLGDALNLLKKHLDNVNQYKATVSPQVYTQPKKGEYVQKCPPKKSNFMTTEEFDTIVKLKQSREVFKKKLKKKREKRICTVVNKIENDFKDSAMRDLVNKFANYMADKCVKTNIPSIMTGNLRRMTYGLVANMYLSLGMNEYDDYIRRTADYGIFETMAYVLVNMIVEAQYQVHVYPQPLDTSAQQWEKYEREYYEDYKNITECLTKRAQNKYRRNK